jgi:predicted component of type VI protein secretion system
LDDDNDDNHRLAPLALALLCERGMDSEVATSNECPR